LNLLFFENFSLIRRREIPCSHAQGIWLQGIEFARRLDTKMAAEKPDFAKFPVFFPGYQGI
jgi:hypothetical protein